MAEKERSFGNWFWNTIRIPQRVIGTAWLLWADAVKTTTWVLEDFWGVVDSTTNKIVGLFSKDKKWYQKILNVPVAAWVGLVWAVEAVVKPVVNWLNNTWKTAVNAVTNAWKSTFGSLFSAKPVSDISFNTLKTKKWVVHLDTQKRTLDPSKPWTINRWNWSNDKKKTVAKTAAVAWAAATAAAVWEKEIAELKKNFESQLNAKVNEMESKVSEMKSKFQQQLDEALKINKDLADKNKALLEDNKNKDWEIAKLKAEIEWLKKGSEKPAEIKPEKKEEKPAETKSEKKEEVKEEKKEEKPAEAKSEKKEEKKEEKKSEWKEGKWADRLSEYIESDKWKSIVDYLKKEHPDMVVKFNKSKDTWHIHLGDSSGELKIWTKNAEEIPTIILHEWAHALIYDEVEWIDDLLEFVENLNEKYGKQLFSVSNKTKGIKSEEDVCELIALYARDDWSFDRHMKKLLEGKNENLAQISESEVEELRDLCEDILDLLNIN